MVLSVSSVKSVALSLNLDQNRHNVFNGRPEGLRAEARQRAWQLPINA
ncbi:hypothetical protein QBA57_20560 [Streptomyces scabiei]|nr:MULTISPECIES: hypothetical protein [Streptomyces]MDW8474145.1 hypothetical protein [Streptomyces scabiei]MDX2569810.1 hypothetical protein [Streptomyces scabiei]MDX3163070.1 hypothetical protein [Streptomyces scabiei]MDX3284736.1 hypothetical protein [Streptomyces scabiei]MDX3443007.1 hypothetical protein [Streptomyces scabiei]